MAQWFKVTFVQQNALRYTTDVALVLATSELNAMNAVREFAGQHFVSSECVPYSTVNVLLVDFQTRANGAPDNVDYIINALDC